MPFDPAQDTAQFLADAKLAMSGTVQFACYLDYPDEVQAFSAGGMTKGQGVVQGKPCITFATADIALAHAARVTIDGVEYSVRWVKRIDDGAFSIAELMKTV